MSDFIYDKVTQAILEELDRGVVPWRKTWKGSQDLPQNFITRKPYRGVNLLLLGNIPRATPFFLSYKQVLEKGGHVKKGCKSHMVVFWKPRIMKAISEDDEDVINGFIFRYYRVFRLEDTSLYESYEPDTLLDFPEYSSVYDEYEDHPPMFHGSNDACYITETDAIYMPDPDDFESVEQYFATQYHELVHSTGHPDRLARKCMDGQHELTKAEYSQEELVAEIGATFLCSHVGIEGDDIFHNATSYIDGWRKRISEDKKLVVIAAGSAQKAVDYILGKDE